MSDPSALLASGLLPGGVGPETFAAPTELARLGRGDLAGTKVLVVDDDVRNAFAMRTLLEARRADVLVAGTGREGLVLLVNTAGIDIILMDIMMPVIDGYEAIRAVRTILPDTTPWI